MLVTRIRSIFIDADAESSMESLTKYFFTDTLELFAILANNAV